MQQPELCTESVFVACKHKIQIIAQILQTEYKNR